MQRVTDAERPELHLTVTRVWAKGTLHSNLDKIKYQAQGPFGIELWVSYEGMEEYKCNTFFKSRSSNGKGMPTFSEKMLWPFQEKVLNTSRLSFQESIRKKHRSERKSFTNLPLLGEFLWSVLNNLPGRSQNHCPKMKQVEGPLEFHCIQPCLSATI